MLPGAILATCTSSHKTRKTRKNAAELITFEAFYDNLKANQDTKPFVLNVKYLNKPSVKVSSYNIQ